MLALAGEGRGVVARSMSTQQRRWDVCGHWIGWFVLEKWVPRRRIPPGGGRGGQPGRQEAKLW